MAEENNEQVIEDDPIEVRRAKREALLAEGKNPYGHAAFEYSHHIVDLDEKYAELADGENTEDAVSIAGRVMAKRVQGKIIFFELQDATGRIQLFCRINALGEDVFARDERPRPGRLDWRAWPYDAHASRPAFCCR